MTAWLKETLKRHHGKWLRKEGPISSKNSPVWPPRGTAM
jgi:uncharacterized protein YfaT (DUF1175 family)